MNILFVCTGNSCRSPMAAALMDRIATEQDLDIRIDSAGLYAPAGEKASDNAVKAMIPYGIDLSNHRTKPLTEELLEQADLVLTMTQAQKMMLQLGGKGRVYTLTEYAGVEGDIKDPYGGDLEEYAQCAQQIYDALTEVAEKLADEMTDKHD